MGKADQERESNACSQAPRSLSHHALLYVTVCLCVCLMNHYHLLCRCGVLQEGDRILQVNTMDTIDRTLEEVNQFLRDSRPRCVLQVLRE